MTLLTEHWLWSYHCYKSFCVISFNPDISPIRKGINITYDAHFLHIRNETEELKHPFHGHTTSKRQSQNSTAKSLTPKPARFPGGKNGMGSPEGKEPQKSWSNRRGVPTEPDSRISTQALCPSLSPHGFLLTILCFSHHRCLILSWLPTGFLNSFTNSVTQSFCLYITFQSFKLEFYRIQ